MPQCLKCGTELQVNEEGVAPVLCDRCAGVATSRARRGMSTGTMRDYPATTALVGVNILVLAAMILTSSGTDIFSPHNPIASWTANIGQLTLNGEYWRFITAGFVHGGFLHIALNMWCLWSLGQLSEKLFGSAITAATYLLTGVGGALLSSYVHPQLSEVGASGAVFGLAGAILSGVKFGNVSISSGQKRAITGSLIFFAGFNLYLGAQFSGVDNWCHVGGFVSGLIFGVPLATANASGKKSFEWLTMLVAALVLAALGAQVVAAKASDPRVIMAERAIDHQDYSTAITLLEKATAENPYDAYAQALLGDAYRFNRQPYKALAAYKRALDLLPSNRNLQEVVRALEESNSPSNSESK